MSEKASTRLKTSHRKCTICGLKEKNITEPVLFAQFPLKEDRCKEWLRMTGDEELVHLPIEKLHILRYVCQKHFVRKDINKKGNRLKKRAIPRLHLTAAPLSEEQLSEFPQHVARSCDQSDSTDAVRRVIVDVDNRKVETATNFLEDYLDEDLLREDEPELAPEGNTATYNADDPKDDAKENTPIEEIKQDCKFSWQKDDAVVPCDEGMEITNEEVINEEETKSAEKTQEINPTEVSPVHVDIRCNACEADVVGFRYVCVQCPDYDLCAACEARGLHHTHYVLRVPGPRPQSEIQEMLQTIRRVLSDSIIQLTLAADGTEVQIKDEEEDPLVGEPPPPSPSVSRVHSRSQTEDNPEQMQDDPEYIHDDPEHSHADHEYIKDDPEYIHDDPDYIPDSLDDTIDHMSSTEKSDQIIMVTSKSRETESGSEFTLTSQVAPSRRPANPTLKTSQMTSSNMQPRVVLQKGVIHELAPKLLQETSTLKTSQMTSSNMQPRVVLQKGVVHEPAPKLMEETSTSSQPKPKLFYFDMTNNTAVPVNFGNPNINFKSFTRKRTVLNPSTDKSVTKKRVLDVSMEQGKKMFLLKDCLVKLDANRSIPVRMYSEASEGNLLQEPGDKFPVTSKNAKKT